MRENILGYLILEATEKADKMKNDMNKKRAAKYEESSWLEYEATFKAMLYHQLIKNGLDFQKISMENSPVAEGNEDIESKKIDIWIDEENYDYFLEVKMIFVKEETGGLRRVNDKDGAYGDLLKLAEILRYRNDKSTFGVAIAVYNGPDDKIDCEYIVSKLNKEVTGLLSQHVKMMICANGKCKYV
jgi:hypothetical protein